MRRLAGPLVITVTNGFFMKLDWAVVGAHCAGYLVRFLVAGLAGLVAYSVIEQFGYRQLTAVWRLRALTQALRSKHRGHWGAMDRRGLVRAR